MKTAALAIVLIATAASACSGDSGTNEQPSEEPLIAEAVQWKQYPSVIPCPPPPGQDPRLGGGTPLRSGVIVDPVEYPTSREALRAFLNTGPPDGEQSFAQVGYVELSHPATPDVVTFGRDFGQGYVILIGAYRQSDGWAVTWWASSGC